MTIWGHAIIDDVYSSFTLKRNVLSFVVLVVWRLGNFENFTDWKKEKKNIVIYGHP